MARRREREAVLTEHSGSARLDVAGAPDAAVGTSATHRTRSYRWPMAQPGTYASLDVGADATASGELPTYRYRASAEALALRAQASLLPSGTHYAPGQVFAYRHAYVSQAIEEGAVRLPAQAHVFARESFWDETARDLSLDPIALRLRHLDAERDAGAREVVRMVSERAAWGHPGPLRGGAEWLSGRGFAMDGAMQAAGPAPDADPARPGDWTAWIVDIDVHRQSGDVAVRRVVAGYGEGRDGPPKLNGVPPGMVERAVLHALGQTLTARSAHDEVSGHGEAMAISLEMVHTASSASLELASDEVDALAYANAERAATPAIAALANAIFDATGVRFREPPFSAERLRHALSAGAPLRPVARDRPARRRSARLLAGGGIAGFLGGLIALACAVFPGPRAMAPIAPGSLDVSAWSPAMLARGRQIALAGDCAVCHTAPGGQENAGGFPLETPFGRIYSTNITPDPETGIGRWSFAAFERAMREGVARDGTHLYPAFPYTAFAKMSEADMLALYAYLMSQPAVRSVPPRTRLAFPLNARPLLAGWKALFHDDSAYRPDASRSAVWNRGKYLVDGAAHCGACHTPRNMFGAEQTGFAYLRGGEAEGWDAPALVGQRGPVPWTEKALFDYLRTGFSAQHGVAAGPMGPVVAGLAAMPESDVRAIAHYIASLSPQVDEAAALQAAQRQSAGADTVGLLGLERGRDAFETGCAVCHASSGGVGHLGVRPLMGLNTSVAHASPDNLLRVLHQGIDNPATAELGYMPGFGDVYDDKQMAEIAAYIRARYAPDQPAWRGLEKASAAVRRSLH